MTWLHQLWNTRNMHDLHSYIYTQFEHQKKRRYIYFSNNLTKWFIFKILYSPVERKQPSFLLSLSVCVCVFFVFLFELKWYAKKQHTRISCMAKIECTLSYCLRLITEVCFVSFVIFGILNTRACELWVELVWGTIHHCMFEFIDRNDGEWFKLHMYILYLLFNIDASRFETKFRERYKIIIKLYLHVAFAEFKWYVKKSRTTRLNISAPDFHHTPTLNPIWILFTTLTNPLHPKSLCTKFNYNY